MASREPVLLKCTQITSEEWPCAQESLTSPFTLSPHSWPASHHPSHPSHPSHTHSKGSFLITMFHTPQPCCAIYTARCHHCTLRVKGQADNLACVPTKCMIAAACLCIPQLRQGTRERGERGRGRGGEREKGKERDQERGREREQERGRQEKEGHHQNMWRSYLSPCMSYQRSQWQSYLCTQDKRAPVTTREQ